MFKKIFFFLNKKNFDIYNKFNFIHSSPRCSKNYECDETQDV